MRDLFSWRLRLSEAEVSKLWESAIFVFDTNFLLDLYRLSRKTTNDLLTILERIQDRIWIPYQVADEFFRNREATIDSEARSFEKALSELESWKLQQQKFGNLRDKLSSAGRTIAAELVYFLNGQENYLDEQKRYLDAVDELVEASREKIKQIESAHFPLNADEDLILDKILLLFDSKVGKAFDDKALQSLYKEADERYDQLIPPGYCDVTDKKGNEKYGDFILWKELLNFAKQESRPIILVTSEKKEDWWIKQQDGKIKSPRLELRREFQEYVNQPFWMYRTGHFLKEAKEKLEIEIDPKSIEETDAIADIELVDEKRRDTLRQVAEHIVLKQLGGPSAAIEQILERTRLPNAEMLEQLGGASAAIERMLERTRLPNAEMLEQLGGTSAAIERMLERTRLPNAEMLEQLGGASAAIERMLERTRLPNAEMLEQLGGTSAAIERILERTRLPNAEMLEQLELSHKPQVRSEKPKPEQEDPSLDS
ncbi:MAG: DUF4935 domain-containing protein [Drouetiella hepatica Uher 2000/2452]|jgi:Mg2+ and Co2+ transporter CorA|uniref:DUF4935 domain-containing protein n=1 Tax=Drouetiella hepatica Uher 2000/2452 TaxID=904376 RepID=A0A951UNP5_9CYAN|nr:DUF4935 domain-containing protein [Drouetiella hepatica Uher 2000/2452]